MQSLIIILIDTFGYLCLFRENPYFFDSTWVYAKTLHFITYLSIVALTPPVPISHMLISCQSAGFLSLTQSIPLISFQCLGRKTPSLMSRNIHRSKTIAVTESARLLTETAYAQWLFRRLLLTIPFLHVWLSFLWKSEHLILLHFLIRQNRTPSTNRRMMKYRFSSCLLVIILAILQLSSKWQMNSAKWLFSRIWFLQSLLEEPTR